MAGGISVSISRTRCLKNLVDFTLSAMTQYAIKRLNWQKFSPNVPLPTKWDCFLLFFINKTWRENMNNFFTQVKTNLGLNKFKISYIFRFFVWLVFFDVTERIVLIFQKENVGKLKKMELNFKSQGWEFAPWFSWESLIFDKKEQISQSLFLKERIALFALFVKSVRANCSCCSF